MNIQQNISLKNYNTFGINVTAKRFVVIDSLEQLKELLAREKDLFLLSGGSNMLLTRDIEQLVVHINIKGISIDTEDENHVYLTVSAGEDWHEFVLWCIDNDYGGLENLSLIPGNVGTSPIQNIGAYGVEVKDVITKVQGIVIESAEQVEFSNKACDFSYRNSIFKRQLKRKVILTSVSFRLTKNDHSLNTSYGAIENELSSQGISSPTIRDISKAVIKIRESKLPDPRKIGNSGSFFKNPVIGNEQFKKLKDSYTNLPFYSVSEEEVKIPAGWLIEQAGFKGKRFGNYGIHKKQALVLVNYGNASGKDIYELAQKIQHAIFQQFEISLEIEVNVI